MSEKRRRGRTPAKPKEGENIDSVNENSDLQSTERKKTLSAPKSTDDDYSSEPEQTDDAVEPIGSSNDMDEFDKALQAELEKELESGNINDIPESDDDNLDDSVMDRGYTHGISDNNNGSGGAKVTEEGEKAAERVIGEPIYTGGGQAIPDVDESLINPASKSNTRTSFNDIPDGTGGGGNKGGGGNNDSTSSSNGSGNGSSGGGEAKKEQPKQFKKEPSENLRELSPKEKREAVEKTADMFLMAYQMYCPIPFIYFSQYNERKLEKLHDADEIDLDTPVKKDGTTFREYAVIHNQKVEEGFTIQDEEIEQLREPLIDVLMEKEVAATPLQRLLGIAIPIIIAKVMLMIKFLREKHSDMETMKEMHQEKMAELRTQTEILKKKRQKQQGAAQNTQYTQAQNTNHQAQNGAQYSQQPQYENNIKVTPTQTNQPQQSEPQHQQNQSTKSDTDSTVSDAKVVEKPKTNNVDKTPTLDDILESAEEENKEETTDDNDIEKGDDTNDIPD